MVSTPLPKRPQLNQSMDRFENPCVPRLLDDCLEGLHAKLAEADEEVLAILFEELLAYLRESSLVILTSLALGSLNCLVHKWNPYQTATARRVLPLVRSGPCTGTKNKPCVSGLQLSGRTETEEAVSDIRQQFLITQSTAASREKVAAQTGLVSIA